MTAAYRVRPPLERFFRYVVQDGDCWRWTGTASPQGYGQFRRPRGGKLAGAHRWLYEELVAEIPDGLELDHLCRNPWCVNVFEHLDPVPGVINRQRARATVTHCKRGHPFDEVNTTRNSSGGRKCLTCARTKPWPIRPEMCGVTTTNYQYGCRCQPCLHLDAERQAASRERRKRSAA